MRACHIGVEVAEGFGFFGFGGIFGIEDGFEFFLFAAEAAHGLGVVEGEAAFLEACVALEGDGLADGGRELVVVGRPVEEHVRARRAVAQSNQALQREQFF